MYPNENTIHIGRVSDQRSATGSHIYNTLYNELSTNAIYLQFGSTDSEGFIAGLRALNFQAGLSAGSHSTGGFTLH